MSSYLVATEKYWNIMAFFQHTVLMRGEWNIVCHRDKLEEAIAAHKPEYIFFPHWSWKVPDRIIDNYPCVCFHMTDLPYGRGGSPLQNLILSDKKSTMLTAFRMTHEWDAGPIYLKKPLSLAGSAEEIYTRAAQLVYPMIEEIIDRKIEPIPQTGDVVQFRRRMPDESECLKCDTPEHLYNHIRMLDAPTYPAAFIRWGDWIIEFHQAELSDNTVSAKAILRKK